MTVTATISHKKAKVPVVTPRPSSLAESPFPLYEGLPGAERLTHKLLPDGAIWMYEGNAGHERLVCIKSKNGNVQVYTGTKDQEKLVCIQSPQNEGFATFFV